MNLPLLQPMVAAGMLSEDDLRALHDLFGDRSFRFVGGAPFGAWGRRAG